jgi:hypothetical protein
MVSCASVLPVAGPNSALTAASPAQPPPWQGPTEGHGGACSRARRRPGSGRNRRDPGGRGPTEIRGSTPCKANCPCTSAGGVERGQGAGAGAGRRECRTAAAGCTAGCPRARRRVTRMPSSTALHGGGNFTKARDFFADSRVTAIDWEILGQFRKRLASSGCGCAVGLHCEAS